MFIEFTTKRNERVFINVSNILYVTEERNNAVIVDIIGTDYKLNCTYEEAINKLYWYLNEAKILKC